jgi:hypothetical protein
MREAIRVLIRDLSSEVIIRGHHQR